jgi:hypothetical protein
LGPVGVLERSVHALATKGKLAASTASHWRGTMEELLVIEKRASTNEIAGPFVSRKWLQSDGPATTAAARQWCANASCVVVTP